MRGLLVLLCMMAAPADAQLKHMRAHGHDPKHSKAVEVLTGAIDFDALPPGEAVAPMGKLLPTKENFVMRGGYRDYDGSLAPPWVGTEAPSKQKCLGFLEQAERAAEAGRQALRAEYDSVGGVSMGKFADRIFGSKKASGREHNLRYASGDSAEEVLARRMASTMLARPPARRRYTVAVTGQSNAAGHGSYFDETYPFAFARAAAGAFRAAGIDLAVQNFAVGGGRTLPTTGWCGSTQLGPSVDFAVWDFTMTEGGKSEIQGEAWVRSMLTLPQPPAALLFMEGKRSLRWAGIYKVTAVVGGAVAAAAVFAAVWRL